MIIDSGQTRVESNHRVGCVCAQKLCFLRREELPLTPCPPLKGTYPNGVVGIGTQCDALQLLPSLSDGGTEPLSRVMIGPADSCNLREEATEAEEWSKGRVQLRKEL